MKTTADLKGVTVQEGAKEYGWSPSNGYYTVRTWKGTQGEIENLIPTVVAAGYEYQVREGPLWTLVAKTPQQTDENGDPEQEVPIPVFELVSQRTDRNMLESSSPFVTNLRPDTIQRVRTAIRDEEGPTFLTGSFATLWEKQRAADVYMHYISGVDTIAFYVPVLRKTYVISGQYIVNESMTVNRIFSKATLVSSENIPSTLRNLLPDSGVISNIIPAIDGSSAMAIPMAWGYLRGAPQYQQIAANQYQVTVEYEYNLWPTMIYQALL